MFAGVRKAPGTLPDVASVTPPAANKAGEVAIISVTPSSAPSSAKTGDLVNLIRDRAELRRKKYGIDVLVTGTTAVNVDIPSKLNGALPVFLALAVGLALLLLMIVVRSMAVPIKAVPGSW